MSKSVSRQLEESRKWLDKNSQAGLSIKPASAALANADKITAELATFKARMAELTLAKNTAMESLRAAMEKVKTEKKLKAKEARLQARLAALTASS